MAAELCYKMMAACEWPVIMDYYGFWLAALAGLAVLFFDSFRRYDAFDKKSPIFAEFGSAPPSLLTTPLVYHQSLLLYYALRVAAYVLPAVVFPVLLMRNPDLIDPLYGQVLSEDGAVKREVYDFVTNPIFPAVWAFASAGFVSLLPYVISIEPRLRRFAQSMAFISHSVQRRLNMVTRSDLALPREPVGEAAPDAFLREVEREDVRDDADWHSLEKRWLRLAQILRMLDPTNRDGANSRFLEEHPEPFQRLTEEFHSLRIRMRYYRTLNQEVDAARATQRLDLLDRLSKHDPELLRDVNKLLGSAEKTLAAALPTSTRLQGRSSQRLREMGFDVEEVEEDFSFGLIFISIVVGVLAGFFGTLLSRGVVEALTFLPMIDYPADKDPFQEATGILVYYAAIFGAVAIGGLWLGAKAAGLHPDAIHPRSYFQRPLGQYVFAAAVGGVLSYLAVMAIVAASTDFGRALSSAGLIAIFLPVLFMTNFLVLFPIYRPSRSLRGIMSECAALGVLMAIISFVAWVIFATARNDLAVAALARGEPVTFMSNAIILGEAIFSGLRSFFVNTAVFVALVYMAHQLREARQLGAAPIQEAGGPRLAVASTRAA